MTVWNYIGWAWIVWTLFNEGLAMMIPTRTYSGKPGVMSGVLSWTASALAVWAATS